jgi:maltooligosyltrehalose synthase
MKIRDHIIKGNVGKALRELSTLELNKELDDKVQLISFRYENLKNNKLKGVLTNAEENIESNRLANDLLTLLTYIETFEEKPRLEGRNNETRYKYLAIVLVFFLTSLIVYWVFKHEEEEPKSNYCLVSQSFTIYENAQRYLGNVQENGYDHSIIRIDKNGTFLVCYMCIDDQKKAIFELERLKVKENNFKLWIYETYD